MRLRIGENRAKEVSKLEGTELSESMEISAVNVLAVNVSFPLSFLYRVKKCVLYSI